MTTPDVPVFTISRRFEAPIERVYEAWADPAQMVKWSGPKGATVEILEGEVAEGQATIACTSSPQGGDMYTLSLWRELRKPSRVAWEQSFCTREGTKCAPPFFDDWPLTLLTEVDFAERDGGTEITLRWTPIEYTEAALAMFVKQMASMSGGWGGSFDKLDAFLAAQS
ncbi:SRPBCC family protein [Alteraurantiacibacter aquimixticola]|uniref:SRPBCC domain-containing protein n=1 Tax=Alteraurantiacibacter aquimixticola TaxID=2489173 RepID=A0A4T3F1Y4_9SPHN|nr:SRPBCC domain-containing protein [Alteraurantiacibacter aquimixticola]TIX50295.1 SRPBCC domain-containing protein [Alteraurantiacibacter aquimixticola]